MRRHLETRCRGGRQGGGDAAQAQGAQGGRIDGNAPFGAGAAGGGLVESGDRLRACGLEGNAECVDAHVRRAKGVISRQDGLAVAACEMDRARVAGGYMTRGIERGDRNTARRAGSDLEWETG